MILIIILIEFKNNQMNLLKKIYIIHHNNKNMVKSMGSMMIINKTDNNELNYKDLLKNDII